MIDRREEILVRLRDICESAPGIVRSARNQQDVSGGRSARPAVIIHDAAESSADLQNRPIRSTVDMIVMTPQIYILLGDRADVIGSLINELRRTMILLIWNDAVIRTLIGGNGDIRYTGCGLDTMTGETREARLELSFEFTYPFRIAELTV